MALTTTGEKRLTYNMKVEKKPLELEFLLFGLKVKTVTPNIDLMIMLKKLPERLLSYQFGRQRMSKALKTLSLDRLKMSRMKPTNSALDGSEIFSFTIFSLLMKTVKITDLALLYNANTI
jgi:hypothetical protein